jgi:hypothetical protein
MFPGELLLLIHLQPQVLEEKEKRSVQVQLLAVNYKYYYSNQINYRQC